MRQPGSDATKTPYLCYSGLRKIDIFRNRISNGKVQKTSDVASCFEEKFPPPSRRCLDWLPKEAKIFAYESDWIKS